MPFYGPGYDPSLDQERLSRHCRQVLAVLRTGGWWTYEALAVCSGVPAGSCRSRVSDLARMKPPHPIEWRTRKDRFREVRLNEEGG
jgi:hypothetical protein